MIAGTQACLIPMASKMAAPLLFAALSIRTVGRERRLVVEVDHEPTDRARPTGRIWLVRIRRGGRVAAIASQLGRPSAEHLAGEITKVINPHARAKEGAIDQTVAGVERWIA